MRIPEPDDLNSAAEWLESYEAADSDDDVVRTMNRVADWLRQQASAKMVRDAAKAAKLPTRALRIRMDAKEHANADRRCGREWSCACAACRTCRRAGLSL